MPFIILNQTRWYIVLSILTVVCIVNLILAIYVTLGLCDEFIVKCRDSDIINYPLYWTIIAIAIITFIILILLFYYIMKMRKVWEAEALKARQSIQMRRVNNQNRQRNGNIGELNSRPQQMNAESNATNC